MRLFTDRAKIVALMLIVALWGLLSVVMVASPVVVIGYYAVKHYKVT